MSIYQKLSIRRQSHCLLVVAILMLAGCARSIEVQTDYDLAKDFSAFSRYHWYDRVSAPNQVVENRIRTALDMALYRRGFRQAESRSESDFHISFIAVGGPSLSVDEVSSRLAYKQGAWSSPYSAGTRVEKYAEGTLIVDFIDPVEGNLMWRGVSSITLDEDRRQSEKIADIVEIVNAILQQFPPPPN